MDKIEIKKILYKQKPKATFISARRGMLTYFCNVENMQLIFRIPFDDIGDGLFEPEMDAKLLIRYLLL